MPPLEGDVDQWVGHGGDTGVHHQRNQLRDIVVVHGMHGGQMRTGYSVAQSKPFSLSRQSFDMARMRIIRFVAMHVNEQTPFCRNLAEALYRGGTIRHGAFEM